MEASPHLSLVRTELDALLTREPVGRPDVRDLVRATEVLPIYYDWTAVGGIRVTDGEVLWVDYDPPYPAQRIDEQRLRNMILFRAHLEYPRLQVLVPVRPIESHVCSSCGGEGVLLIDGQPVERAVCYCGGTGWLPGEEPDAFERGAPVTSTHRAGGCRAKLRSWIRRLSHQAAV
jgi:hypothetical protein